MTTHSDDDRPALEVRGLTKRYGARAALHGVDLDVPRGVAFGLLGPNGAGKTTIIRAVLGLAHADGGTMRLLGHTLPAGRRDALRRVGAVVEEPRFHHRMTGRENLRIHAAVLDARAAARIPAALERVGLTARADDRVAGYSLGMRQRLGIARCLLCDPELLVLDEPANGLDPAGIRELRALVRSFVDEGRTVILSSHLLDEVERTCDVAAIVARGRVVAQGPVGALADAGGGGADAVELRVAGAAEAAVLLRARAEVDRVDVDGDRLVVRLAVPARERDAAVRALVRALVDADRVPHGVAARAARLEDRVLALLADADANAGSDAAAREVAA